MSKVIFSSSPDLYTKVVERAAASLPQTAQSALFTVSGRVLVTMIVGEVTTIIQNQANATKLVANPTVGADVDLCATNDIADDAVGTLYTITGDFSDAMVATTSGAVETSPTANSLFPIIVADGTIDLNCPASNTGAIKWTIQYKPLDRGSYIVAA